MKPNDSDFIQTRDDLKQLIEILEEDQLSIEKSQLLMMLEDEKVRRRHSNFLYHINSLCRMFLLLIMVLNSKILTLAMI